MAFMFYFSFRFFESSAFFVVIFVARDLGELLILILCVRESRKQSDKGKKCLEKDVNVLS